MRLASSLCSDFASFVVVVRDCKQNEGQRGRRDNTWLAHARPKKIYEKGEGFWTLTSWFLEGTLEGGGVMISTDRRIVR
jgi:hypothetical protein